MGKKGFEDLLVWQRGKDLAVYIYRTTSNGDFASDFGLRDQIRRAAVSIPSNIAEGDERETDKEAVRFFYIAKGSSAEVLTQAMIACEIGYLDKKTYSHIEKECKILSGMLSGLIAARSKTFRPSPFTFRLSPFFLSIFLIFANLHGKKVELSGARRLNTGR